MTQQTNETVQALIWTGSSLKVLDQRKLPDTIIYDEYQDAAGVTEAIASMRVRGAPAIGIAAAYGVALSVSQHHVNDAVDWQAQVFKDIALLAQSRPTAVNLFWALAQMEALLAQNLDDPKAEFIAAAEQIHADDIAANIKMGEMGADLLGGR